MDYQYRDHPSRDNNNFQGDGGSTNNSRTAVYRETAAGIVSIRLHAEWEFIAWNLGSHLMTVDNPWFANSTPRLKTFIASHIRQNPASNWLLHRNWVPSAWLGSTLFLAPDTVIQVPPTPTSNNDTIEPGTRRFFLGLQTYLTILTLGNKKEASRHPDHSHRDG